MVLHDNIGTDDHSHEGHDRCDADDFCYAGKEYENAEKGKAFSVSGCQERIQLF